MSPVVIQPNKSLALNFVNKINERHKRLAGSPKGNPAVSTFAENDDIVPLTEKFLDCLDFFRKCNSPNDVTLTYHYTNREAMSNILQNGLMTAEQQKQQTFKNDCDHNIKSTFNGATYGEGIYTATNPFAFSDKYGELGLIVAVIKGKTQRVKENTLRSATSSATTSNTANASMSTNTVIGNKLSDRQTPLSSHMNNDSNNNEFFDEVVLLDSSQCLPLVQFSSSLVSNTEDNSDGNDTIWAYHKELQQVVDTFFNNGEHTVLRRIFPSMKLYIPLSPLNIQHIFNQFKNSKNSNNFASENTSNSITTINVNHGIYYNSNHSNCNQKKLLVGLKRKFNAIHNEESVRVTKVARQSPSFPSIKILERIQYKAPAVLNAETETFYFQKSKVNPKSICPICMEHFSLKDNHNEKSRIVSLAVCNHHFHLSCIEKSFAKNYSCPVCRKNIREPQGTSPSGVMVVTLIPKPCSGFESCRQSIGICYILPSGIQKAYHENPLQHYNGTNRRAYLPNNEEGWNLLERLKYAWRRGLIFRVGTSLTTGRSNCIIWSSIHHKTRRTGGVLCHGFPDNNYFNSCNQDLTSLGVPSAPECRYINKY